MEKNNAILGTLQEKKEYTKQIIITSILIGIGVNTLVAGIVGISGLESYSVTLIFAGAILSTGAVIYYLLSSIKKLNKEIKLDGFIIYDPENKSLVPVRRYEVVEDMIRYLSAAFSENKAMKTLWESSIISDFKIVGGEPGKKAITNTTESGSLFIELLEYCMIEKLSTHLCDYFNDSEMKNVHEISKKEIPDILLENRFLRLFSEEMNNREVFSEQTSKPHDKGKIVAAYHSSGAIYQKFDLILPNGSKVTRKNKNFIEIETDMFTLSLGTLFRGFNSVLPLSFEKRYIGLSDPRRMTTYEINVEISIHFKPLAIVSSRKWMYYAWADKFIERIDRYLSKDYYFNKINWSTVQTLLECQKNEDET